MNNKERIKRVKLILLPAILLSTYSTVSAYEWVVQGGVKAGGDTVYTFRDVNNKSDSVIAGRGLALAVGVNTGITNDLKLRALIGASTGNSVTATEITTNDTLEFSWTHMPLDFLVYKETGKWSYGAGLTVHLNPELKGISAIPESNIKFDSAVGLIAQLDYSITEKFYIGLNYTQISYDGNNSKSYNGSGAGINLGYSFGE